MTFNPAEKHQSQIPALQLLVALGYEPLSQAEAVELRGGRLRNVVLDDMLVEQLLRLNSYTHRGRTYPFDLADAHEAVRRLKPTPDRLKGLKGTNQDVYDSLVLGTTIAKTIDGESRSFSFRYIDWERPENNVWHVTAEFAVERTASTETKRCDIVAFVNGIPFLVIENKRPTESLGKADSQLVRYQQEDAIPQLFHFAQLLMSMNRTEARYATVGTPRRFWQAWRDEEDSEDAVEPFAGHGLAEDARDALAASLRSGQEAGDDETALEGLVNKPLGVAESQAVFTGERAYFDELLGEGRAVTAQDRVMHALCRPDRMLDLVRRFTVFDGGTRKVARHPQFFGVRRAVERVRQFDSQGRRRGGVIWHTQGSGKSLTMVMLARALALDPEIVNPRIVIVTDRDDLDVQIRDTFKSCELEPVRARTGAHLTELIRDRAPLVTTIINKFMSAARQGAMADDDPNLFVLVDESHRSQSGKYGGHGTFARHMRHMLPQACYLGFTGTPLMGREKNTLADFGGLIHKYAIDEAVEDGAVVPLLYEGRLVAQQVAAGTIDAWFEKISEGLTDEQKADLKRKFSRMDVIGSTQQAIQAKAFDISAHWRKFWAESGYKAQLVAPTKAAAIRFKQVLDEIGDVTSEIVISAPDDNEGNEEVDKDSKGLVRQFWTAQMERFGSEEAYTRQIIEAFKGSGEPEILIVVSKLLIGFDAPRNTVLYVCKPMKEHTLLQAIARVNRLHEGEGHEAALMEPKRFGFIVDYEGLLGELDKALSTYSALEGYDDEDLIGTVRDVKEEIRRLPQLHDHLWDLFKPVANKKDMEQFEQYLADQALREDFYERLRAFGRCLHVSMSSDKIDELFSAERIARMTRDWKMFTELRRSVQLRYQEVFDVKAFEPKIRKLLDDHVVASPAETIIELVNINDPDALQTVVEEAGISQASKADRIASATRKAITENMDRDPAFYRRFSEMLEGTIRDYKERRLSEKDFLQKIVEIAKGVAGRERGSDVPEPIRGNDHAQAFFGVVAPVLAEASSEDFDETALAEIALAVTGIVGEHHIVDIWSNDVAQNKMRNAIDDYFYDVVRAEMGVALPAEALDALEQSIMTIARARFPD